LGLTILDFARLGKISNEYGDMDRQKAWNSVTTCGGIIKLSKSNKTGHFTWPNHQIRPDSWTSTTVTPRSFEPDLEITGIAAVRQRLGACSLGDPVPGRTGLAGKPHKIPMKML
jgi:hypothetical protein